MKRYLFFFLLCPFLLLAEDTAPQKKVLVHNRVLAYVNGKAISVIDLMKKMDMILFQNYPQYLEVPEARYQFYMAQWRNLLSDWIDRELVLADAEEKKFEVSSGDVREELEEIFGPNMMMNLDSTGLTLDEAFKMLKDEITIRRMLYMQVRSRVFPQITPTEIRKAYDEYVKKLGDQKECVWSAISIRSNDTKEATDLGEAIYTLVTEAPIAPEAVQEELKAQNLINETATVTVSAPFRQKSSELSASLQELFLSMKKGQYSRPQLQKSRTGQAQVVRIYFLHEQAEGSVATIEEMETKLKEEITEKLMQQRTEDYFNDLRSHFHVSKSQIEKELPENFQPFEIK